MPVERSSTVIGPPADALAETLESIAGDELQAMAEYDARSFELLYVSDRLLERHDGLGDLENEANALFEYYHLDFLEREMVEELLWLGEIGTFVTFLDHGIVVRAQTDGAAVFVALDVTASVDDVQIAIQNTIHDA